MEYLIESREYFKKYRDTHMEEYFEIMHEYRPSRNSGYGVFHRSDEVTQIMRDIYFNLLEVYCNLSIPEKFATPRALVESWVRFKSHLEVKGELFEDIKNNLIKQMKKKSSYSENEDPYDSLPQPYIRINTVRLEVLDLISHILNMAEVSSFINPDTDNKTSIIANDIASICRNFHKFCLQLNRRYGNRKGIVVKDEYDVQDLLHSILKLRFNDVRAEECTPSYAGGASKIDFLISDEEVGIEVKKTRKNLRDRHVGDQLIIDIDRYKVHPKCKKLICFVYDSEHWLTNPYGLETDLSREKDGMAVEVIVCPKGI